MFTGIANIIKAIGGLSNTFWGLLILICSMYVAVHYNQQVGYYFAGIGSTLVGINHPPKKETPDAGNSPN
jgi:TM2 domain-containing membrane protein YozV